MNSELQNCQQTEPCTVEEIRNSLEQSEKGKVYNTAANYKRVLQYDPLLKGAIRKNLLTERIDIVKPLGWYRDSPTLTDVDVKYLLLYFEENYGLTVEKKIIDAVAVIANENRYHPVCDFLNALQWDGTERIRFCLHRFLGSDTDDYTYEALKLFLLGAISRAFKPGCKFEVMLCLVGGQGAGKSSFFRLLAVNDDWFSDRVFVSGSYGEALCIIGEYVNITDSKLEHKNSLRQQLKATKPADPVKKQQTSKQQER